MKSNLSCLSFLLCFTSALAQTPKLDSLFRVLKEINESSKPYQKMSGYSLDTLKANTLNAIAWESFNIDDYDSMKKYADEALTLSNTINYSKGKGTALNTLGNYYREGAEYDTAIAIHTAAIAIGASISNDRIQAMSHHSLSMAYMDIGKFDDAVKESRLAIPLRIALRDTIGLAAAHTVIGNCYKERGKYAEALVEHFEARKLREVFGDSTGIASSLGNIANVYNDQGQEQEALELHRKSMEIALALGHKPLAAHAHNNIGVIYANQNKLDEALAEHKAALQLRQEINDLRGISYSHQNIGVNYSARGMYKEALNEYFAALEIEEQMGNPIGIITAYLNIGEDYVRMKNPVEGKKWFNKGVALAQEVNDLVGMQVGYHGLAMADSATGDFKSAFVNYKRFVNYRDSIINNENTRKIVQTQMQYDFDKKEAATKAEQDKKDALTQAQLRRQRIIRNAIGGGFLLVALFSSVVVRQRNRISSARKRSDELLLNILPGEIAEELKQKGRTEARHYDSVTVMFTDFKGFTLISEKLSPTELVNEIDTCFKAFDAIISRHNIEKIKTIGDSYMCVGGLPVTNTTHARDVVTAALEIRQFMELHKRERESAGRPVFEIRIGMHTGPVVAGVVGVTKYSYDVWGDTVNTASRMESSGEAGKVNISGATHDLVKDAFVCTYRGKIEARNKGSVDMYFVENAEHPSTDA